MNAESQEAATPPTGKYVTLGRSFRTPAHPEVLAALGRVYFTVLSLEESVTAILYESGHIGLSEARGKMAGQKEDDLGALARLYRKHPRGVSTADGLDAAKAAFGNVRKRLRNPLSHAHPFTAGADADGNYLPGLAYTVRDGSSWRTLAIIPDDLLDLVVEAEQAIDPLGAARRAVQQLPLSSLRP